MQKHRTFLQDLAQRVDRRPIAMFIKWAMNYDLDMPLGAVQLLKDLPGNLLHQFAWIQHIEPRAILGLFLPAGRWIFVKLTALGLDVCNSCSDTSPDHRHGSLVADDGSEYEGSHDHLVVVCPVMIMRGKLAKYRHMLVSRYSWKSLVCSTFCMISLDCASNSMWVWVPACLIMVP